MGIDLNRLASQGRAFSGSRVWTPEEWEAVLLLESECGIGRQAAADFVRNGILTVEAYNKAVKADFVPKTIEAAHADAEVALKEGGKKAAKSKK